MTFETHSSAPPSRAHLLARARSGAMWDVLVIGGGASGLGCALDAAARGYSTLLLEAHDFAKGTSSRSTKLIHGGVRYLAQGRLELVREALRERGRLLRNAPHLVHTRRFVLPTYQAWERPWFGAGIAAYELLAGANRLPGGGWLSASATRRALPNVQQAHLQGGIAYQDAQFDDARLALCLLRSVFDAGGCALNYLPVQKVLQKNGRCAAVVVNDQESGQGEFEIAAHVIINATGVWADQLRRLDNPSVVPLLAPSQGVHLVVGAHFMQGDSALLVPRTEDGRVLFVIPWMGKVLLGTTDTPRQHYPTEPQAEEAEIDYILRTAARYLQHAPQRADVLAVFAGLRPLISGAVGTSRLSREHVIEVAPSGLITLCGGKWTTYRQMAEDCIDRAEHLAGWSRRASPTAHWLLHGAAGGGADIYGSDRALINALPGAGQLLHAAFSLSAAEVRFAVHYEMARHVEDVLARRHRALFLDARAALEVAPAVAAIMAECLGLQGEAAQQWRAKELADFSCLAARYCLG